jgi:hypothetical protein
VLVAPCERAVLCHALGLPVLCCVLSAATVLQPCSCYHLSVAVPPPLWDTCAMLCVVCCKCALRMCCDPNPTIFCLCLCPPPPRNIRNPMEAFNFTTACEDCNLYTYDMRKLDTAACVHKVCGRGGGGGGLGGGGGGGGYHRLWGGGVCSSLGL